MHINSVPESSGDLNEPKQTDRTCVNCKQQTVTYQIWESSCGGYEDFKYTCSNCKKVWWIDGIDS